MLNQSINPITKKLIVIENEPQRYVKPIVITQITPKTSRKNDIKLICGLYKPSKECFNGTTVHSWDLVDTEKFTNTVNYFYQKHHITKI